MKATVTVEYDNGDWEQVEVELDDTMSPREALVMALPIAQPVLASKVAVSPVRVVSLMLAHAVDLVMAMREAFEEEDDIDI